METLFALFKVIDKLNDEKKPSYHRVFHKWFQTKEEAIDWVEVEESRPFEVEEIPFRGLATNEETEEVICAEGHETSIVSNGVELWVIVETPFEIALENEHPKLESWITAGPERGYLLKLRTPP